MVNKYQLKVSSSLLIARSFFYWLIYSLIQLLITLIFFSITDSICHLLVDLVI